MVKNKGTQDTQCCPDSSSSERSHTHSEKCCASDAPPASADSAQEAFQAFMAKALAPGAIDVVQKELMTIALSVAVQCRSCLKIHMEKARKMGLSPEEIEEAAWMGVVFGGCRSMMFWNERTC